MLLLHFVYDLSEKGILEWPRLYFTICFSGIKDFEMFLLHIVACAGTESLNLRCDQDAQCVSI